MMFLLKHKQYFPIYILIVLSTKSSSVWHRNTELQIIEIIEIIEKFEKIEVFNLQK